MVPNATHVDHDALPCPPEDRLAYRPDVADEPVTDDLTHWWLDLGGGD